MPFPQRVRILFGSLSPSNLATRFPVLLIRDVYPESWIPDPNFFHPQFFPSRIPDPGSKFCPSWIPDHGSEFFPSWMLDPRSASKNLSIFAKKKWFLSSQKYDPGFPSRILIPDFLPIPDPDPGSQIPNPGVKKAQDPWSRILDPDSQHCRFWVCLGFRG